MEHAPYVCNGCEKPRHLCPIQTKYDYNAKIAQRLYEEQRTSSREGINLSKQELHSIDRIVRPLVEQGQSPYMILTNHPELDMSVKTLYNYISQGVLLTRNVDLKRKTKFKPRKCHKKQIINRAVFEGRTYNDFKALELGSDDFAEMDTVLSARGSLKCILTIYFPDTELLVARLLQRCTPGAVRMAVDQIQNALGDYIEFALLMPTILVDRGREFGDPDALELDKDAVQRFITVILCEATRKAASRMFTPCSG